MNPFLIVKASVYLWQSRWQYFTHSKSNLGAEEELVEPSLDIPPQLVSAALDEPDIVLLK